MSQVPVPGGSVVVPPALDLLPDGVVLLDREGRCRYLNAHARRVADHAGGAVLGQRCWDVFPQVRDGSVRALIERVLENRVPASLAAAQLTSPGAGGQWVEVTVVPEPATGGALVQWHDVTARVRGERWARTQADLLRRVAEGEPFLAILERLCQAIERKLPGSLASVLLLDEERRTLHPAAAPSLPPGFVAHTAALPVGPDMGSCGTAAHRGEPVVVADIASDPRWDRGRAAALVAGLRACWSVPICGAASAAEAWTALDEASGATAAAAARVLGTFAVYYREPREPTAVDLMFVEEAAHLASVAITRERRERALQRVEARLAFALDAARLGTWHWDAATNRTQWSEAMGPLFGRPRGTPAPATERLLDPVLPDDRPRFEDAVRAALGGESEIEIEFRVVWPDGTVHWLLDRGRVTRDAAGRPRHMDGVVADITERRAAEQALVEREKQLQHARRLEAIGRLAGGGAHDFNNLLTVIQHSATFALEALPSGHPASAEIREIARATTHAAALTRQLLAFGRRQLLRPEVVDLRRVVGEAVPLVRRLVGGHVDVRLTVDEAGPALVHADPSQLTEVLLNLAANARDAMGPSGGSVTISLGRSRLDRDSVKALCAPWRSRFPKGGTSRWRSVTRAAGWTRKPARRSSSHSSRPRRSGRARASASRRCMGSSGRWAARSPSTVRRGRGRPSRCTCPNVSPFRATVRRDSHVSRAPTRR
ncbi:MAG TPA: PAS domain-containing protein [Gemmatimonadaceae bacterium]